LSQVWPTLVAVLALLVGLFIAFAAEGFMMAGSANSSPAQLQTIKTWMWSIALGTLACAVVSIVLMAKHHPWIAAGVGFAPAVILIGTLFVILIIGSFQ
jgi:hypothetical protein